MSAIRRHPAAAYPIQSVFSAEEMVDADADAAVGQLIVDYSELAVIDINPVLVTAGGAIALDVHIGWNEPC